MKLDSLLELFRFVLQIFNREWQGPGKSKIKNPHHSFLTLCSRTGPRSTGFQEGLSLGPCLALLLLSMEHLQKLGSRVTSRKLWVPASQTVPGDRWVAASLATLRDRWVPASQTFSADNWVTACWIALGDCWVPASRAALGDRWVPVSRGSQVTAGSPPTGLRWGTAGSRPHGLRRGTAGSWPLGREPSQSLEKSQREEVAPVSHASHKGGDPFRLRG